MKGFVCSLILVVLLAFSVAAVSVDDAQYRIETLQESSGWNSRGYVHVVDFEWKPMNPSSLTRDVCFRSPVRLAPGSSVELLIDESVVTSGFEDVTGFSSYGVVDEPCEHQYHYWVFWPGSENSSNRNETRCFDGYESISGGFRLRVDATSSVSSWRDVSSSFTERSFNDGSFVYCVPSVTWTPGEVKTVRFRYWDEARSSFKWDALFGDIATKRVDLALDPFTNSTLYNADFTIDNSSTSPLVLNATKLSSQLMTGTIQIWSFDNTDTIGSTLHDDSGNGHNGTLTNAPTTGVSGLLAQAYTFDGAADYMESIGAAGQNWTTLSVWMKPTTTIDTTNGRTALFGDYTNGYPKLEFSHWTSSISNEVISLSDHTGVTEVFYWNSTLVSSISSTSWHHLVFVWESGSGNYRLYFDGVDKGLASKLNSPVRLVGATDFGRGNARYYGGSVDEMILYSRSLSANEVAGLYNGGAGRDVTSTVPIVFQSKNISASINVSSFRPTWNGNPSSVNISFDGGAHYVAATNNTLTDWSQTMEDRLVYRVALAQGETFSNFKIVVFEGTANETDGRAAILAGVAASEANASSTAYADQQVYIRLANGTQALGTFDEFIVAGDRRYGFNYDPSSTAGFPTMYNVTPVFYVWQGANLSTSEIASAITTLINATYG